MDACLLTSKLAKLRNKRAASDSACDRLCVCASLSIRLPWCLFESFGSQEPIAGHELTLQKGCTCRTRSSSDALVLALERRNVKVLTAGCESSAAQAAEAGQNSEQLLDSALVAACPKDGAGPVPVPVAIYVWSTTKASKPCSARIFNVLCTRLSAWTLNTCFKNKRMLTGWQRLCRTRVTCGHLQVHKDLDSMSCFAKDLKQERLSLTACPP
eukprot:TRINITY_DN9098_c0_g1_i12.p3 TRINITY_DN9098_c0_g1~~TRINITY_DN9098_c0_g1_i12.p3  ORF type:complete len:213 (-),score=29.22 TRINITY_DN9098_c0_g1_i12:3304-3942(-)